jgi:hypothetical protein
MARNDKYLRAHDDKPLSSAMTRPLSFCYFDAISMASILLPSRSRTKAA